MLFSSFFFTLTRLRSQKYGHGQWAAKYIVLRWWLIKSFFFFFWILFSSFFLLLTFWTKLLILYNIILWLDKKEKNQQVIFFFCLPKYISGFKFGFFVFCWNQKPFLRFISLFTCSSVFFFLFHSLTLSFFGQMIKLKINHNNFEILYTLNY